MEKIGPSRSRPLALAIHKGAYAVHRAEARVPALLQMPVQVRIADREQTEIGLGHALACQEGVNLADQIRNRRVQLHNRKP